MAVYEAVLNWSFNSNVFNTVLHYDTGSSGEPDFLGLTDDIRSKMNADFTNVLAPNLIFTSVRWREDTPGGVGVVFFPTDGPRAGTAADNQAVGQTAAIIRKLGSGLVRPNKGRIYQPGVSVEGIAATGLWQGTVSNFLETFWESMIELDDGDGVTASMVIKASNPSAPNTVPYNPVTGMQALGNPGTQRRRRLGVGQ